MAIENKTVLCSVCEIIHTNNPSGVCTVCEKLGGFGPDEQDKDSKHFDFIDNPNSSPQSKGGNMGNKPCSVEGCKTPSVKDGLCFKHYKEKHGKPPFISQKRIPCSIRGCKTPSVKAGFCWKHYREKYKEHPYTPSKVKKYTQKKSRVSSGEPADNKGKNIGMIEGKISGPGIISIPTAFLGQLLYSSELLDKQINSAIENGVVDIKTIINIRFRLGALLRGRILLARCLNETF